MSRLSEHHQRRRISRRPVTWIGLAWVAVLVAVGLWAFQPWRLWTHSTVNEALPGAEPVPAPSSALPSSALLPPAPPPPPSAPLPPPPPVMLAEGQFVTQEHETTGLARLIELPDGSRFVRLADFSTSDGPDLHVWLTDQAAGGEWGKYDDGRYLPLGELKATAGNQNYAIPHGAGLTGLTSVVIWCDRFNVAFGSAPLRR